MRNDKANPPGLGITLAVIILILGVPAGFAHPMGNFSVNHYTKITIGHSPIDVRYLIDIAEIPTFQEMRQWDITPSAGAANVSRYLDMQEKALKGGSRWNATAEPLCSMRSRGRSHLPTARVAFLR
jgi:hypothetical protein